MKKIVAVLLLSISCFSINAQELVANVAYQYFYSKQLDDMVKTYNFSRPSNENSQPLFMNGLNASLQYVFKSERNIKNGIGLSYSFFNSSLENTNLNNSLFLNFIEFQWFLRKEHSSISPRLYSEFLFSLSSYGLYRRINYDTFLYNEDDIRSKAFGVGGTLNYKFGMNLFTVSDSKIISAFINLGFCPYFYSPNSESVINQTKGLIQNNWNGFLSSQVGLSFRFKAQK